MQYINVKYNVYKFDNLQYILQSLFLVLFSKDNVRHPLVYMKMSDTHRYYMTMLDTHWYMATSDTYRYYMTMLDTHWYMKMSDTHWYYITMLDTHWYMIMSDNHRYI